jgi:integrase
MSVRKRIWASGSEKKSAWIVDYFDQDRVRRQETFALKKDAEARWIEVGHEVREGTHTARAASLTVAEAAKLWLEAGELDGHERSTLEQRRGHIDHHIVPLIGRAKLADLSTPRVQRFADDLLSRLKADGTGETLSRSTARKVLSGLKSIITHAQRQGQIAKNPAQPVGIRVPKRGPVKLKAGRDFPDKAEINIILNAASGRWHPLIVTAIFTGMRASELRGLRWEDVDLDEAEIHVHQRADHWGTMGAPKSEAGERTIPMTPMVANTLKEWKLTCPRRDGALDLVFPNGAGKVEAHANFCNRGWYPLQIACGLIDDDGRVRYSFHCVRHFYATWLIDQGFPIKRVQSLLGHSTMAMTSDVYGHLFDDERDKDHERLAAAERELLARGPRAV